MHNGCSVNTVYWWREPACSLEPRREPACRPRVSLPLWIGIVYGWLTCNWWISIGICSSATWVMFVQNAFYYVPPPHPWDEEGHLDLLWFPVAQMCVGVRPSVSASVCARLWLRDSFSPMTFKISDMVTTDKTLNWWNFLDHGSIFKVIGVIMFQN